MQSEVLFEPTTEAKSMDPTGLPSDQGVTLVVPQSTGDLSELRRRVLDELAAVDGHIALAERLSGEDAKEQLRLAHGGQRQALLEVARTFITEVEPWALDHFANGNEIDPGSIDPYVVPVVTQQEASLFRLASLQWSVPVSQGYGRRTRFLVIDRQNEKVIGIFALGDPVIAQSARDAAIGWTKEQRSQRLYNVLDAFVLGAVEPYRQLIGGKLLALCTLSNEVRQFIVRKYEGSESEILAVKRNPTPVLITTSSALGRSSVYNRLTYNGSTMFHSVGFTKGYGHFQFSEALFADLKSLIRTQSEVGGNGDLNQSPKYGSGPNWRFRVLRTALSLLGIPEDALRHNLKREVFLAPAALNWDRYLRGEDDGIQSMNLPLADLAAYYRNRWAIPRSERRPGYKSWRRSDAALSPLLGLSQQMSMSESAHVSGHVKMAPVSVRTGAQQLSIRGKTLDGTVAEGDVYVSEVIAPGVDFQVADISWANGHREVRGWQFIEGPSSLVDLVGRLRIGVYPHPDFEDSVVMDLRMATQGTSGRLSVTKLELSRLLEVAGYECLDGLDQAFEVTLGTRESLLRDEGRRRGDLCAVLPRDQLVVPTLLWIVIRLVPLLELPSTGLERPVMLQRSPKRLVRSREP